MPHGYDRATNDNPYQLTEEEQAEKQKWVEQATIAYPNAIGGSYYHSLIWDICHRTPPEKLETMKARIIESEKNRGDIVQNDPS